MNTKKVFISLVIICISSLQSSASQTMNDPSIKSLISAMSLEEKVSMVHGAQGKDSNGLAYVGYLPGIERLGIPPLKMQNGPCGAGATFSSERHKAPATAFPVSIAQASTWNPDLLYQFGQALGSETKAQGRDVLLGPSMNIIRIPEGGRNFEYLSEDPYLSARCAVPIIKGIQEMGTMACAKHFVANNQETWRHTVDEQITERALREIYLPAFEASVKEAKVASLMASYNKINSVLCSENPLTLRQIAKTEWGFPGFIMTDWGTRHKTNTAAMAGLDLEMSGYGKFGEAQFKNHLANAIKNGEIKESVLDEMVYRILYEMKRFGLLEQKEDFPKGQINTPEHHKLSLQMALEGAVLLKNENSVLPLDPASIKSVVLFGDDPNQSRFTGGGSSKVIPFYHITPLAGLKKRLKNADIVYSDKPDTAPDADAAIVFIYRPSSESSDRETISLEDQTALIKTVAEKYNKTIVILRTAGANIMPWIGHADAVLQMWYPGQEEGNAEVALLCGDINPSGKLPVTFGKKREDFPGATPEEFPGIDEKVEYAEGIFVGYRYFDHNKTNVLFPFGYGLSYTSFEIQSSGIKVDNCSIEQPKVNVAVKITNTGNSFGAEVVQLYVRDDAASLPRPEKELKTFQKVFLQPGETKTIDLALDFRSFAFWNPEQKNWIVEPGKFTLFVGNSSRNISFQEFVTLD